MPFDDECQNRLLPTDGSEASRPGSTESGDGLDESMAHFSLVSMVFNETEVTLSYSGVLLQSLALVMGYPFEL